MFTSTKGNETGILKFQRSQLTNWKTSMMNIKKSIFLLIALALPTLASAKPQTLNDFDAAKIMETSVKKVYRGSASYYGPGFHGRKTASGERFNQHAMTIAHRTLPFGTKVKVTCVSTGKSVTAMVNDRGPFHGNRIVDLSYGAAKAIGMIDRGVTQVKLEVLN